MALGLLYLAPGSLACSHSLWLNSKRPRSSPEWGLEPKELKQELGRFRSGSTRGRKAKSEDLKTQQALVKHLLCTL